jgi:hypothetical protein
MTGGLPSVIVSNVLSEEKKQQVVALGRLGWSLRLRGPLGAVGKLRPAISKLPESPCDRREVGGDAQRQNRP